MSKAILGLALLAGLPGVGAAAMEQCPATIQVRAELAPDNADAPVKMAQYVSHQVDGVECQ